MDFLSYLVEKALILVPVLYVIGAFLKSTPKISDWLIPWILLAVGIVGGLFVVGFNYEGVIQGILIAGVTVLGNQLIKQTTNKN